MGTALASALAMANTSQAQSDGAATAAAKSTAQADFTFYKHNIGGGNHAAALEALNRAAQAELPAAQVELGVVYRDGRHIVKNSSMAAEWFGRAMYNGVRENLLEMACFTLDYGSKLTKADAAVRILESAENNNLAAQVMAARMYATGLGVDQNQSQSGYWYVRAQRTARESLDADVKADPSRRAGNETQIVDNLMKAESCSFEINRLEARIKTDTKLNEQYPIRRPGQDRK